MAKRLNYEIAFSADTAQLNAKLKEVQTSLEKIATYDFSKAKFGDAFTKDIEEAATAAQELQLKLVEATNVKTGQLDLSKFRESLGDSKTALESYATKLSAVGPEGKKAFLQVASAISQAELPMKRSNALLSEMWVTMKNTARWQITSSALHGFMGALSTAYGYAQDLNESLTNIRIVTSKSTEEMEAYATAANKAAAALSTTTTNYTDASLIYYQQGLDDEAVQARTEATVKLANVTSQSAETVSEQMTAIWNNFDDGSESLEYYADVITALGASTASSSAEISEGLSKFASVATTVGLSYEYATSALATVVAETRQSADVVGTALILRA